MHYKCNLTFVDGGSTSTKRLETAVEAACHFDASLAVLSVGYSLLTPYPDLGEPELEMLAEIYRTAETRAAGRARDAEAMMASKRVRGTVVPLVCTHSEVDDEIGHHAQFADLVILDPAYGDSHPTSASDAVEGTLFIGDAPVLICSKGRFSLAPEVVLIAWNGSEEAMRAVRSAMPFLECAKTVTNSMIELPSSERATGGALVEFLLRHGVATSHAPDTTTSKSVAGALRQHVTDLGAGCS